MKYKKLNLLDHKSKIEYKYNNNISHEYKYPIIWCTKYQCLVFVGDTKFRLKDPKERKNA
jgi:hypothetical protein